MRVDDQPRYLVVLVRHHGLFEKGFQRQVGQCEARGDTLFLASRREVGQFIAGSTRRCACHQRAQVFEAITAGTHGRGIGHRLALSPVDSILAAALCIAQRRIAVQ